MRIPVWMKVIGMYFALMAGVAVTFFFFEILFIYADKFDHWLR
jgi:hypothetical protein